VLGRFSSDGIPDPAFGAGGTLVVGYGFGPQQYVALRTVRALPGGALLAAGYAGDLGLAARHAPNGAVDIAYGDAGLVTIVPSGAVAHLAGIVVDATGAYLGGDDSGMAVIWRYTAQGALDPAFGNRGVAAVSPAAYFRATALLRQAGGKLVSVG